MNDFYSLHIPSPLSFSLLFPSHLISFLLFSLSLSDKRLSRLAAMFSDEALASLRSRRAVRILTQNNRFFPSFVVNYTCYYMAKDIGLSPFHEHYLYKVACCSYSIFNSSPYHLPRSLSILYSPIPPTLAHPPSLLTSLSSLHTSFTSFLTPFLPPSR